MAAPAYMQMIFAAHMINKLLCVIDAAAIFQSTPSISRKYALSIFMISRRTYSRAYGFRASTITRHRARDHDYHYDSAAEAARRFATRESGAARCRHDRH